jgi:hypothetical protein
MKKWERIDKYFIILFSEPNIGNKRLMKKNESELYKYIWGILKKKV